MQELNFSVLLGLLFRHIKVVLVAGLVLAVLMASYTFFFVSDTYASKCSMYVMNISTDTAGNTTGISTTGLEASQRMVNEYITILRSDYVIGDVSSMLKKDGYKLSADGIRGALSMEAVNDTAMLQITATTGDPKLSRMICEALMECAPDKVTNVMLGLGSVRPVDAPQDGKKVNIGLLRNTAVGLMGGCVLSYLFFLLLYLMDNTIKEEKELKERFNVNVLGVVPDMNPEASKKTKKEKTAKEGK